MGVEQGGEGVVIAALAGLNEFPIHFADMRVEQH